jgi:hypothetical protein
MSRADQVAVRTAQTPFPPTYPIPPSDLIKWLCAARRPKAKRSRPSRRRNHKQRCPPAQKRGQRDLTEHVLDGYECATNTLSCNTIHTTLFFFPSFADVPIRDRATALANYLNPGRGFVFGFVAVFYSGFILGLLWGGLTRRFSGTRRPAGTRARGVGRGTQIKLFYYYYSLRDPVGGLLDKRDRKGFRGHGCVGGEYVARETEAQSAQGEDRG